MSNSLFGVVLSCLATTLLGNTIRYDISPSPAHPAPTNITCNQNEDCYIWCTAQDSCSRSTMTCPTNHKCIIQCVYLDACWKVQVYAYNTAKLNIICSSGGLYSEPCNHMIVNATGSSTTSTANITCGKQSSPYGENFECYASTLNLSNFDSILLNCLYDGCHSVKLLSYQNDQVNVYCKDYMTCEYSEMYINQSNYISFNNSYLWYFDVYINGLTNAAEFDLQHGYGMNWYFENISHDMEFNCHGVRGAIGKGACELSKFYFQDIISPTSIQFNCYHDDYDGCESSTFYIQDKISPSLHLDCYDTGCYGVKIIGESCNNVSVYCSTECQQTSSSYSWQCNQRGADIYEGITPTSSPLVTFICVCSVVVCM